MKTILRYYFPILLLLIFTKSHGANFYVSATGSDGNNGLSASSPFRTIQKAANLTNPGDIVYVMNGTYTNSCATCDVINITRSGTSSAWIRYVNYSGHTPKIKFNSWQGIKVFGASYIEISGFEIEGNNANISLTYAQSEKGNVNNPTTSGNGIYIENNGNTFAHHVRILSNRIHDCGGHGIGSHWADYITIDRNTIYNNAWYSPLGCSGISLYQNKNYDTSTGFRIRISNNRIYNNRMFIPFFYNGKIEDGNGMIIDDARNTQNGSPHGRYNGAIRVENNVVFDNGGKGIHAYLSDNMEAVNNTCFQNCKSPEVKDGELSAYACSNVKFYNNATYSRSDARANHDGDGSSVNVVFNYNIYYNYNTSKKITKGPNDIVADPRFIAASTNPATANFRLQSSSPGINKGTTSLAPASDIEKVARPYGAGFDIGAYEFHSTTPSNLAPSVSISSPAANSGFKTGASIVINAAASDKDGTIKKVEFFQGTTKLGEDLTSPYSFTWGNVAAGKYTLTAKATDNSNAVTTSSGVIINVSSNTPPAVSITSPANSSQFKSGATIVINASASDANGTVSKVEFFRGTTKLGEDLSSPYSYSWTNVAAGGYTLTAKATDNGGAVTTSSAVNITVEGASGSNCITKTIPQAAGWRVKNSWSDQNNGSFVSNNTEALVITHRAWGNSHLWAVDSATVYNLVAGREYTVKFDFKDDAYNKITSLEAGFAKSHNSTGVTLWQPTVVAPSGYSSTGYTTKSLKIKANTSGVGYLSFKLNWAGQPNNLVKDYLKNLSVCYASATVREASTEENESTAEITVFPNPTMDHSTIKVVSLASVPLKLEVFDVTGNLVEEKLTETNTDQAIGESLRAGLYFIKASFEGEKRVVKWIKN